ncbi:hypothetical protein GCM10027271_30930 [Saccharopolyspora gloriosae]|uniref:DUF2867 domain-containing protein n=1 Tax=Saccharopolyspora gloriosae TaxID=455344 RepID=A0A840NCI3_9PSEU|nr:hypothetical protein [Saccharopolyspora gloriosae]MBB5070006.1 hypothetical protein [Saccharopolyspora gloriosae]
MEGREHDVREGETTRWAMTASGHPQEEPPGIDDFMDSPDFAMTEHLPVRCPPRASYAALRHLDLLTVRSPVIDAAMLVRGWPARLRRHMPARTRTRLTFDDLVAEGNWVRLSEKPDHELVLGAAGRFWTPVPSLESLGPGEFERYDRPRHGRIAMSLSARAYGRGSLLSYDVRVSLDDALSLRTFGWYWWTAGPFIRLIMRATLRRAAADALTGEDES